MAVFEAKGHIYDVIEPEIIDAATACPQLSPRRRRLFRAVDIDQAEQHLLAAQELVRQTPGPGLPGVVSR